MKTRRKAFYAFRKEFSDLCEDWLGVHSERDSIGEGIAYLFETPIGRLAASIHCPCDWKREEILPGSIYLRFHSYTGPQYGPGRGDFNQFSHKWNIHYGGDDPYAARQAALLELYNRLAKLLSSQTGNHNDTNERSHQRWG